MTNRIKEVKTLYWNGISDVQVDNETKKSSKRIGIASIGAVLNARKAGDVRQFALSNGKVVGINADVWSEFVALHDKPQLRENVAVASLPAA